MSTSEFQADSSPGEHNSDSKGVVAGTLCVLAEKVPRSYLVALGLAYAILAALLPRADGFDDSSWRSFAEAVLNNGLGRAYETSINYNPLYLYVLADFSHLEGSAANIDAHIALLRLFSLVFDIGAVYLAMRVMASLRMDPFPAFFILLNVAYLYNTLIWGQVDTIHTFLVFSAVLAAVKRWPILSLVLFLLALNQKSQAIAFLPQVALLLLPQLIANKRRLVQALAVVLSVQTLVLLPFILSGELWLVIQNISGAVGFHPWVSANAFNLWYLVLGDLANQSDTAQFWGLSYRIWGLLFFSLASFLVVMPVAVPLARAVRRRFTFSVWEYRPLFLSLSLSALAFFFFNTEMHERYVHPAILFAGVYAILSKDYLYYGLLSVAYFLNLEKVMSFFGGVDHSSRVFDARFIACIFLTCFAYGTWQLFRLVSRERIGAADLVWFVWQRRRVALGVAAAALATGILLAYAVSWLSRPLAVPDFALSYLASPTLIRFGDSAEIVAYDMHPLSIKPGETLTIDIYWRGEQKMPNDYRVFLHLFGVGDLKQVAQQDSDPEHGKFPTSAWVPGQIFRDTYYVQIPSSVVGPALLHLNVGLYATDSMERLPLSIGDPGYDQGSASLGTLRVPAPSNVAGQGVILRLDDGVEFAGAKVAAGATNEQNDRQVRVELEWAAAQAVKGDYTVFVHMIDAQGHIVAQHDGKPANGNYPTNAWQIGETISDVQMLTLPSDLLPGDYRLVAGIYDGLTMRRLAVVSDPAVAPDAAFEVGTVTVGADRNIAVAGRLPAQ